jgi:hypothetical protein
LFEGGAGFRRPFVFPPLVAAPSGHADNDEQAGGNDVIAEALPQLFELLATDFLVDFLENIGHGLLPQRHPQVQCNPPLRSNNRGAGIPNGRWPKPKDSRRLGPGKPRSELE